MNKSIFEFNSKVGREKVLKKGFEMANEKEPIPKFRMWYSFAKMMLYSDTDYTSIDNFYTEFVDNSPDTTLMQDIALKDRENKAIYVGDILEDTTGWYYIVFKVAGGFAVNQWQDEDFRFYNSTSNIQTAGFIESNCKVVGNIFEGVKDEYKS